MKPQALKLNEPTSALQISVIVPAFNEVGSIAKNLARLHGHLETTLAVDTWELLVVDDGSRDETARAVRSFAKGYENVRFLSHEINRGIGAALKSGIDLARGACVITLDSDLSYEPSVANRLLDEWRCSHAALVLASPYMRGGSTKNVPATRLLMSVWANKLLSLAGGGRIKTFTGMVRAYDRKFLSTLTWPEAGNVNVELLLRAVRAGVLVKEIPAQLAWPADRGAGRLSYRTAVCEILAVLRYCIDFVFTRMPHR